MTSPSTKQLTPQSVYLVVTIIAAALLQAFWLDFQGLLSTGDHGRDLYAFEQTSRGAVPYQDYWWVYGPLMPYYYGLFIKFFGASISTVLIAKTVIKLVAAIFFYLSASTVIPPFAAFIASVWFLTFFQDFFFTYNHIGGIAMVLGMTAAILHYIKYGDKKYLYLALAASAVLCFIKVNFGATALLACAAGVFISDRLQKPEQPRRKTLFYVLALAVLPVIVVGGYAMFVRGLSIPEIRQCLPYLGDDQPYNTTPFIALSIFIKGIAGSIISTPINIFMAVVVNVSLIRFIYLLANKQTLPDKERLWMISVVAFLAILYVLNFHEFIKSGVWYRSYWSQPLSMMLMFIVIATAIRSLPQIMKNITWAVIAGVLCLSIFFNIRNLTQMKQPSQWLAWKRGAAFVQNDPHWTHTVNLTTAYILEHLQGEDFFALPYDPLYYFLTGRTSPTRQLIFFDHIKIPPEQELKIIEELRAKDIRYIVLSNRYNSPEPGMGQLGVTYCPLIGKYIRDNYIQMAQFGDFVNPPGWGWNHGTVIMKKKDQ